MEVPKTNFNHETVITNSSSLKKGSYLTFASDMKNSNSEALKLDKIWIAAEKLTGKQSLGSKIAAFFTGRVKINIEGTSYLVKAKHISERFGISKAEIKSSPSHFEMLGKAAETEMKLSLAYTKLLTNKVNPKNLKTGVKNLAKDINLDEDNINTISKNYEKKFINKVSSEIKEAINQENSTENQPTEDEKNEAATICKAKKLKGTDHIENLAKTIHICKYYGMEKQAFEMYQDYTFQIAVDTHF